MITRFFLPIGIIVLLSACQTTTPPANISQSSPARTIANSTIVTSVSAENTVLVVYSNSCSGESYPGDFYRRRRNAIRGVTQVVEPTFVCENTIFGGNIVVGIGTVGQVVSNVQSFSIDSDFVQMDRATAGRPVPIGTNLRILQYIEQGRSGIEHRLREQPITIYAVAEVVQ